MRLLGTGEQFGVKFYYASQLKPEGLAQAFIIAEECGFLTNFEPCALILGDNIFHGPGFTEKLNYEDIQEKRYYANYSGLYSVSIQKIKLIPKGILI